jgi:catechol 2,3-dioxygenase-like lactoylglutathione lyase family enzyme
MPRCDHVAFRVHDLERSIAFYERMLPGRVIARRTGRDRWRTEVAWIEPEGQAGFAIVLIMPRRVRFLLKLFHALVPRAMRGYEHVGFACRSRAEIDEREQAARALGARILNPPTFVDEKVGTIFEIADPDDIALEWTHGQTFG